MSLCKGLMASVAIWCDCPIQVNGQKKEKKELQIAPRLIFGRHIAKEKIYMPRQERNQSGTSWATLLTYDVSSSEQTRHVTNSCITNILKTPYPELKIIERFQGTQNVGRVPGSGQIFCSFNPSLWLSSATGVGHEDFGGNILQKGKRQVNKELQHVLLINKITHESHWRISHTVRTKP